MNDDIKNLRDFAGIYSDLARDFPKSPRVSDWERASKIYKDVALELEKRRRD